MFFQCLVSTEGRKVGSLKRRVRSHLGRWEIKNCTPLWREAHFEAKVWKADHVPTTVGRSTARHDTRRDDTTTATTTTTTTRTRRSTRSSATTATTTTAAATTTTATATARTTATTTLNYTTPTQHYTRPHCSALHYTTLHCTTLHYTTIRHITLHNTTATKTTTTTTTTTATATAATQPQLQYATPRYIQQLWVRWPMQPIQKDNSNHLSVLQWVRSAIHASQQLTSPIVSFLWNFRHRLVRYYW